MALSSTASRPKLQYVGIDGSPGSIHALKWAVAHRAVFGEIQPVVAWQYPWWTTVPPMAGAPLPAPEQDFETETRAVAEGVIADLEDAEGVRAPVLVHGNAGEALVEAVAATADEIDTLIVVGTRGHGALLDTILGSVSTHVVSHSDVPVAVVPTAASVDAAVTDVVVGVDGSPNGQEALRWAVTHLVNATRLRAITAWGNAYVAAPEPGLVDFDRIEADARAMVHQVVDEVTAEARAAQIELAPIEPEANYGDPRSVLRAAASEADALVLGARGHRGIAHLLLGSVASAMIHQPTVTTIIVPHRDA